MAISPEDLWALRQDKYGNDPEADMSADIERLGRGEPLAYVIGWAPFLGLRLRLDTHPLIPRAETEWWTEKLIAHLKERFGDGPFTLLDLCAGSGAIGLAVLKAFPSARVSFGELSPRHLDLIRTNLEENHLNASRADLRSGDLFAPFENERFDIIATNPPYVPSTRSLPQGVVGFEPAEALFAGEDGLAVIRRIAGDVPSHLASLGELWLEADIDNIEEAKGLLEARAATCEVWTDPYGRARLLVSYYS